MLLFEPVHEISNRIADACLKNDIMHIACLKDDFVHNACIRLTLCTLHV